jgi:hypothetical protein
MKTEGPNVQFEASCFDCVYQRSDRYVCQGDSGFDVSCAHPEAPSDRSIGDTTWTTPSWCPLVAATIARLVEARGGKGEG